MRAAQPTTITISPRRGGALCTAWTKPGDHETLRLSRREAAVNLAVAGLSSPSAASAATAGDKIEPFLSVVKHYTDIPRTGSAPVDDFIRQMEPRVELATKEAVTAWQRSFRPGIAPQWSPFLARRCWSRQQIHQPSPTAEAVGWPLSTVIDWIGMGAVVVQRVEPTVLQIWRIHLPETPSSSESVGDGTNPDHFS
jgi:hypothetical protein